MRNAKGFTLIEVLVVIAIIAILAALLLPVLNRGKANGQRIACLNNIKQLSTAFFLYAITMAQRTFVDFHFECVRIMAADTGIAAFYMVELGIIQLAIILISTLNFGTIQSDGCGKVVHVDEAKIGNLIAILERFDNLIGIFSLEFLDLCIHLDLSGAALVADHTARFRTKAGYFDAG